MAMFFSAYTKIQHRRQTTFWKNILPVEVLCGALMQLCGVGPLFLERLWNVLSLRPENSVHHKHTNFPALIFQMHSTQKQPAHLMVFNGKRAKRILLAAHVQSVSRFRHPPTD